MNKAQVLVQFNKNFRRQYKKLPKKVQDQATSRIAAWQRDPDHAKFRDHHLKGDYAGYRSINITGDVRALYYRREDGIVVIFAFIGTHSQLYG